MNNVTVVLSNYLRHYLVNCKLKNKLFYFCACVCVRACVVNKDKYIERERRTQPISIFWEKPEEEEEKKLGLSQLQKVAQRVKL